VGLLDDAIREHLDLKRCRGADPAEIERAERDALGPVRRNREPEAADDTEAAADGLDPVVGSALDEPDEGVASDLAEEPYGEEDLYDEQAERPAARAEAYLEDDEEFHDDPFEKDENVVAGQPPFSGDGDPHRTQLMSTVDAPMPEHETAEHDVERSFVHEDDRQAATRDDLVEGEDEDVLEETPEFLQDTPDHDRLWFEQRPPRDFDFDG
jgi:hypothetical protein